MSLLELCCRIDQEAGTAQLGGHIGNLEGNGLLGADRPSELDPFLGIFHRSLIGSLGNAQSLGRNADTAAVQGAHGDLKAHAFLAQKVLLGDLYVIKIKLAGSGGPDAQLVIVRVKGKAFPALFHDQGRDAPGADAGSSDGKYHVGIRFAAVGDKDLFSVQKIVVAHILCRRFRSAGV